MKTTKNTSENFPDWILEKWQGIADLLAEIIGIPAALIRRTENEFMEVFISSHSENNPYHVGEKEKWDKNPDIKPGMVAYLGFPLNYPDNQPFGTLCVLDNKERPFTLQNEKLIQHFKNVIELDLALMQSFEFKTGQLPANVFRETAERKNMEEALRESQLKLNEAYKLAHLGIWEWEATTDTVTWSEELYRISGLDP